MLTIKYQNYNIIGLPKVFKCDIFAYIYISNKIQSFRLCNTGESIYDIFHIWMIWCNSIPNLNKRLKEFLKELKPCCIIKPD